MHSAAKLYQDDCIYFYRFDCHSHAYVVFLLFFFLNSTRIKTICTLHFIIGTGFIQKRKSEKKELVETEQRENKQTER